MRAVSSSLTILTTCWPGLSVFEDVAAERALLDLRRELLDDAEVDVGLEQREADLAHGGVDVGLGQRPALTDVGEGRLELLGECVEHRPGKSRDSRTTREHAHAYRPRGADGQARRLPPALARTRDDLVRHPRRRALDRHRPARHAARHPDPHRGRSTRRGRWPISSARSSTACSTSAPRATTAARPRTASGRRSGRASPTRRRGRTPPTSRASSRWGSSGSRSRRSRSSCRWRSCSPRSGTG